MSSSSPKPKENQRIPAGTPVLVTGATGFTGSFLVRRLVEMGVHVRAIARSSSDLTPFQGLPIQWFRGEVHDQETVHAACQGVEYIFHVAAAYRQAKIKDEDYKNVHVESTKLLAYSALRNPGFRRFVHVSTVGVHGHIDTPPADENYRFAPGDIYQRTKLEGELWIREFAKEKGLAISVVRPAAIMGPGDKRLLKVFRMAAKPIFPVLGFGKCLYHLIHVDDLVSSMILCSVHPAALNEVFICGNSEAIRLVDLGKIVAQFIGNRFFVLRVPVTPFFIAASICEALCKPFGIEPPIYRRRVSFFTKDRSFDTRKLREKLGFVPAYDNRSAIEATARWYVNHSWLKSQKMQSTTGDTEGTTLSASNE